MSLFFLIDANWQKLVRRWRNVDQIVEYVTAKCDKKFTLDFIEYARKYIALIREQGRTGTAKAYQTAINALERFVGGSIDINSINLSFLKKFEAFIFFLNLNYALVARVKWLLRRVKRLRHRSYLTCRL